MPVLNCVFFPFLWNKFAAPKQKADIFYLTSLRKSATSKKPKNKNKQTQQRRKKKHTHPNGKNKTKTHQNPVGENPEKYVASGLDSGIDESHEARVGGFLWIGCCKNWRWKMLKKNYSYGDFLSVNLICLEHWIVFGAMGDLHSLWYEAVIFGIWMNQILHLECKKQ